MADKMNTVQDLMITGMTYALDFDKKAAQAASKMAEASSNTEAKQIFEQSVSKGKEYGDRLEQAFKQLNVPVTTNENHIAKAMITEVEEMIKNTDASPVRDAALIVAANQMQHYRLAVYGSLETYAKLIGKNDVAKLFNQNLEESKGGDSKLTKIAEEQVNQKAAQQQTQNA